MGCGELEVAFRGADNDEDQMDVLLRGFALRGFGGAMQGAGCFACVNTDAGGDNCGLERD